jgi:hypothetical protein
MAKVQTWPRKVHGRDWLEDKNEAGTANLPGSPTRETLLKVECLREKGISLADGAMYRLVS